MQLSQVSEALRTLTELGVITAVRLGRKNIYYVRPVGEEYQMPPSNPEPFFLWLAVEQRFRFQWGDDGSLRYAPGSQHFERTHPVLRAIFDEYVHGLRQSRLYDAIIGANMALPRASGE